MTTTTPSTALVAAAPAFSNTERLALAGFLAGYSGLTREAYELDLRQFASWCHRHHLRLFAARRADIECFARDLEARGRARATVTRRLCAVAGFYRYAVEEELLDRSPAVHVRRPRLDYESHATAPDRNEMGALLAAAGLGPAAGHALISLLALNGLRVSEAAGAGIEAPGVERGHRTLAITRKGGKAVTIPLAPRTARAIDLATGERCEGPVFLARAAGGRTGTAPGGSSAGPPAARESPRTWGRIPCGTRLSPPPWTRGSPCETCRKPPRTPTRGPPRVMTAPGRPWTGTLLTSSPPTSPEPPLNPAWPATAPPGRPEPSRRTAGKYHPSTSSSPNVTPAAAQEPPICAAWQCRSWRRGTSPN